MKEKSYKETLAFAKAGRRAFWHVAQPDIPPIEASSTPPAPWKHYYTPHSLAQKCLTNDKNEGESIQRKRWRLPRPGDPPFGASPGPASRPLRLAIHLQSHWKSRAIPHSLAQKMVNKRKKRRKKHTKETLAFAKAGRRTFWLVAWPGIPPIEASSTPPALLETPLYTPFASQKTFNESKQLSKTHKASVGVNQG